MRLLKRDVPQQPTAEDEDSSSPPPQPATGTGQQSGGRRDSPSDIQQLGMESRVDETVPALPPKQSKYSTESSTTGSGVIGGSGERTTPALPPRIDTDIEVCNRQCEGFNTKLLAMSAMYVSVFGLVFQAFCFYVMHGEKR